EDTNRQLLAKQRAELEEEMKRRGEPVAALPAKPAPVPVAAAPVEPPKQSQPSKPAPEKPVALASVAPTRAAAGVDNPRFPSAGDHWEYAYVETIRRQPLR